MAMFQVAFMVNGSVRASFFYDEGDNVEVVLARDGAEQKAVQLNPMTASDADGQVEKIVVRTHYPPLVGVRDEAGDLVGLEVGPPEAAESEARPEDGPRG